MQAQQLQTQKVYIEYCINCSMHSWCTFHDESRYHYFLDSTRDAILNHNPQAQILQNTLPKQYIKRNNKAFQYGPQERVWDDRVEQYVRFPRVGAFEVYWNGRVIYSKLRTGMWPNPNMVGKYLKELIRDKNKNISTKIPQTKEGNENFFITRAKNPNKVGKKIVTYDQTTDEEPYIDQEDDVSNGDDDQDEYDQDEDYKGYEMGLEKADQQYNQQIILDHSAGPGGTHSPKNQGLPKKAMNKRSTMSEKKQKKLGSSIPSQSSQNPKRRSPSTNRTINTATTPNNLGSNLTRSQSKPAKSRLNTQSSTQSKNPNYMKSSGQFEQPKGIPNMKQQYGQNKGGKSTGTLKTQSYEGSRKSFQSSSKRSFATGINKSRPTNQKYKSKQNFSPSHTKKPQNSSLGQGNRNQKLSIDSSKDHQLNNKLQHNQQRQQKLQKKQAQLTPNKPQLINNEFSSIKKMQLKTKSQQSEEQEEEDEKIIFANDGKQKDTETTPNQALRGHGSQTPLHQTQDPIQFKQQNQRNQQNVSQKGNVLNPISKKSNRGEEQKEDDDDYDEDYGGDQFDQEDKQTNRQNQTNPKSIQFVSKKHKKKQQEDQDQDYGEDDFQNEDDSKLQKDKTQAKKLGDDDDDDYDDDGDDDDDDDDNDARENNQNNYQKFSFKTPYSKDDDDKINKKDPTKIPPLSSNNNNDSAQEQYQDDAFQAQGDISKDQQKQSDDYQEQMAQSTSNPKIELASQKQNKGAVNQMLNQQSPPPLVIGQGNQVQLASDSEDDNEANDYDDDDDDDQGDQINITKVFQMQLAINKMSSKKINYYNNDDVANQYQLMSSHPEIMSVKDENVTIPQNSQGKFQLRFGAVSQPCQQQAVLFVLKNNEPFENILFSVSYT